MGFLKGKTKELSGTPQDIRGLRGNIASQYEQGLSGNALAQGFQGVMGQGGPPPAQDMRFFYENLMKPYQELFAAQRGSALGQAKECAGNLTGSGYNNILGSSLSESLGQEQALGAQTLLGLRQQEIARQQAFMQMLMQFSTAGVGQPQAAYQPGALDYLLPGLGQIGGQWAAGGFQRPSWLGGGNQMPQAPNIPSTNTGVYNVPVPGYPSGNYAVPGGPRTPAPQGGPAYNPLGNAGPRQGYVPGIYPGYFGR